MALEWSWWKDWWRLKKWRHRNHGSGPTNIEDISDIGDLDECCCDECYVRLLIKRRLFDENRVENFTNLEKEFNVGKTVQLTLLILITFIIILYDNDNNR